jgi:hypothetical protein
MNNSIAISLPSSPKVEISRLGLEMTQPLTFEEWRDMAPTLGQLVTGVGFVIGDWLVYGETHFSEKGPITRRVSTLIYDEAVNVTGLDRRTLHNYAYVARRVPTARRSLRLSWEHHRIVAKLPALEQERWLNLAEKAGKERVISTMRLRKSINAGRLLTLEELLPNPADRGRSNHIPHLNRLRRWWLEMKQNAWHKRATPEQKDALKRDFRIILQIMQEIG